VKRRTWLILGVGWLLMGGTAAFLATHKQRQVLGAPGVRVVPEPIAGLDEKAQGTNAVFQAGAQSVYLPARVLDYESKVLPVSKVVWDWLPKDTTYGQRQYWAPDGFSLQNLVVLMGADRTSIHKPQYCLTGSGWQIDTTEKETVRLERPHPYDLPVMKLTLSAMVPNAAGVPVVRRGLFIYWFVADGQLTADHGERMWWMARDLVTRGVLQRWAYVICFAECPPGQEAPTFQRLRQFIAASVPEYQSATGPALAASLPAVRPLP
jgi:hypothetical protein